MYKYVQMPTQVLKQTHKTHKTHTPACCHFGFCAYTGVLCERASSGSKKKKKKKKKKRKGESRIIYMHHSLGNRDQRTKCFLNQYKYINI